MNSVLLFLICVLSCSLAYAKSEVHSAPLEFAHTLTFNSQILKQNRSVNVYLPAEYQKNTQQTYPVIYLLDGSKDEDFIHIAGLVQFANFPWLNFLPPSIVVGISNQDRKRDFTTQSNNALDKRDLPTHGGAKSFIAFLQDELRPMIEKRYRTNQSDTLIGQSLGGLLASEILFHHTPLFDHYVIVSPSLWWDNESLLASKFTPTSLPKSVYIAVGKEGNVMERVAKQLHDKIATQLKGKSQLHFRYFEDLDHGDTLHLAVYDAFKKVDYK
ncbi:alpha/beta hydrolase-fold protein [Pseudoalteromonas sp. R3]|uniref:alpha/beta hydrolase n=1 Tax=Pseudoalteromonas sp. R3 TaxID=1709477 RepID=UPI0006B6886C|nr:alpha/beta hydrolase-fold protein [Pseudoalteromonas sp. R3]AZZ98439.1 alpha/beta hydrolase [Pseudoalteromonas sp. R3]